MLVLSRQRDESAVIGDHIEVTIIDIRGDKVRLGINAPREIQVHRKEVYESIHGQTTQSDTEHEHRTKPSSKPSCPPPDDRLDHRLTRKGN